MKIITSLSIIVFVLSLNNKCTSEPEQEKSKGSQLINSVKKDFVLFKDRSENENTVFKFEIDLKPSKLKRNFIFKIRNDSIILQYNDLKKPKEASEMHLESFISKSILNFEKENYLNKCIEDGELFKILIPIDENTFKTVKFHNVYNSSLDSIITLINNNILEEDRIFYSKEKLLALPNNCE